MAITVDIRDNVSAALKGMDAALAPAQINPAIGRAEVILFQKWFQTLPSNRQGFPSTGFWSAAARATNFNLLGDGLVVSVNKQGVRQRYQGGTIKPTGGRKYLTIPARSEAYGKRAGEFPNLVLAFRREGGQVRAFALVEARAQGVKIGKRRKDGSRKVTEGEESGGGVMFWLVKSVTQKADQNIIPSDDRITAVAMETIGDAVERAFKRGGGK